MTDTAAIQTPDRCKETSTTTGTGTLNLAGAVPGFRTLVGGAGTFKRVHYCIVLGTQWETGVGTVTAGSPDTLTRDFVGASSSGGSLVSFSAGTKTVFIPATHEFLTQKDVVAATADVTLGRIFSGLTVTNEGATALVTATLPGASGGQGIAASPSQSLISKFAFFVADTDGLKVLCAGSDVLKRGERSTAAGGYLRSSVIGSYLEIENIAGSTVWTIVAMLGRWTWDGTTAGEVVPHSGNLTLVVGDMTGITHTNSGAGGTARTQTLPLAGLDLGATFAQVDAGTLTVTPNGADHFLWNGGTMADGAGIKMDSPLSSMMIKSDGNNRWLVLWTNGTVLEA